MGATWQLGDNGLFFTQRAASTQATRVPYRPRHARPKPPGRLHRAAARALYAAMILGPAAWLVAQARP